MLMSKKPSNKRERIVLIIVFGGILLPSILVYLVTSGHMRLMLPLYELSLKDILHKWSGKALICKIPDPMKNCSVYFTSRIKNNLTGVGAIRVNQTTVDWNLTSETSLVLLQISLQCSVNSYKIYSMPEDHENIQMHLKTLPKRTWMAAILTGIKTKKINVRQVFTTLGIINKDSMNILSSTNNLVIVFCIGYKHVFKTNAANASLTWMEFINIGTNFNISMAKISLEKEEAKNTVVLSGGKWVPSTCIPRWRLAVIVPYRKRASHLNVFLHNMHSFLQAQNLEYHIFVIEQAFSVIFNRGLLMNIGYLEANKHGKFDCYAFHDVDLIPESLSNYYGCPAQPRHLATGIEQYQNYRLLYKGHFGGCSIFTKDQFQKINGFSNIMFGWGGEDDDIYMRVKQAGMNILRYPPTIGTYTTYVHARDAGNPQSSRTVKQMLTLQPYYQFDGINSASYEILETTKKKLFTNVLVKFDGPVSKNLISDFYKRKIQELKSKLKG